MKYFLQREDRSFGPYSVDDLKRYQGEGRIGPEDKIRAEDSEQWVAQTDFFNPPAPMPQAPPVPVFTPPPAAPSQAPNPFASPTDANPVWNPPTPPQQQPPMQTNPFAAPGAAANPFGAPPAQGGFGAPPAQGFGGPPAGQPGFGPAPSGITRGNLPNANIGQLGSFDSPPPVNGTRTTQSCVVFCASPQFANLWTLLCWLGFLSGVLYSQNRSGFESTDFSIVLPRPRLHFGVYLWESCHLARRGSLRRSYRMGMLAWLLGPVSGRGV